MGRFSRIKSVIFMGKKPWASKALEFLLKEGINVRFVVCPQEEHYSIKLWETAVKHGVPVLFDDKELYKKIADDGLGGEIDLVISFLFWRRMKMPLIELPSLGCVNFHPAPLPDYKGRAGYNTAILDKREDYGVSAHFVDSDQFDAGPIIKVLRFPISASEENAYSLEAKTQEKLFDLFVETMDLLERGEVTTTPNKGGLFLTLQELEKLKEIDLSKDNAEDINRKIRAFFFPPYSGAKILVGGKEFTLVNGEILKYIRENLK